MTEESSQQSSAPLSAALAKAIGASLRPLHFEVNRRGQALVDMAAAIGISAEEFLAATPSRRYLLVDQQLAAISRGNSDVLP